jgi:hypothetical protein
MKVREVKTNCLLQLTNDSKHGLHARSNSKYSSSLETDKQKDLYKQKGKLGFST